MAEIRVGSLARVMFEFGRGDAGDEVSSLLVMVRVVLMSTTAIRFY
jgi:hypothetical protein